MVRDRAGIATGRIYGIKNMDKNKDKGSKGIMVRDRAGIATGRIYGIKNMDKNKDKGTKGIKMVSIRLSARIRPEIEVPSVNPKYDTPLPPLPAFAILETT